MKQNLLRKFIPHVIAVVIFLIIAVLYCKPALEGQVVNQHDISSWKGAVQQSVEYAKTHDGKYPLWTNSLFSGMPTFQIAYSNNNFVPGIAHKIFTLGLPEPIQFFFLACICFYFLAVVLGVNPYVGIMGALAYAYATYNPVIIGAGHVTKMLTMAYLPALLGSLLLIYERRYWIGAALTALFTSLVISMNHPQIAYYFFIAAGIMTIFYVINWIRAKELKHLAMAIAFTAAGALIGVLTNSVTVLSTYEYQKETIRGGGSPLTDTSANAAKNKATDGLDPNYAFSYSLAVPETFVMMVPRMYGGSSGGNVEEISEENSKAVEALQTMPPELQQQLGRSYYWGGIQDLRGITYTSGPPYIGAITCFLMILGCFIVEKKYRWWLIAASLFTIMMSWGSYFSGFNNILFDYFPLYNKFRAPSMALVIPQLLFPMMAILAVNRIIKTEDKKSLWPDFKKGLIATGVVFVVLFLLYFSLDYQLKSDKQALAGVRDGNPELYNMVKPFFDGMVSDRKSMFMSDIWRALGFIAVAAFTLFMLIRKKISGMVAGIILCVFVFLDLILVDIKYLNSDWYQEKSENEAVFMRSATDNQVLADTSYYRVYSLGNSEENNTSYNYNSVGGYHAAKLRLYNDIILHRLPVEENAVINALQTTGRLDSVYTPTFDMLNTKYFLQKGMNQATRQPETVRYWQNPHALGYCWFVDSLVFVKNADEEMAAIGRINPRTTAVAQESFRAQVPFQPQPDSSASITLVNNDNDVAYYTSNAASNQFAVFSEVYYAQGWKAFIDGKETPIIKVNYILRGLAVPAGKHNIEFRFEPPGYFKGKKITAITSWLLIALLVAGVFMEWKRRQQQGQPSKTGGTVKDITV
jgi:hypothetical protein